MAFRGSIPCRRHSMQADNKLWGIMSDIIMLALILGLFGLGLGFAYACEGL